MTATTTNVPSFRPTPTPDDITEVLTATGGPTVAAAEALAPRIDYDVEGALRAGLTAKHIAEDLAGELNYDIAAAREAGVTDDQIINELSTARMPSVPAAIAEGAARGAIVGLPMLASGATGVAMGTPLGPFGMLAGGTIGTVVGLFGGTMAEQGLEDIGVLSDAPLVPGLRPFMEGARTFGGGAAVLSLPGFAVRNMPLGASKFIELQGFRAGAAPRIGGAAPRIGGGASSNLGPIDRILRSYQRSPGLFMAGETSALGAAGVGGGFAEAAKPGNEYLRMSAEMALGIVNPVGIVSRFGPAIRDKIMSSIQSLSPEGRANRLGTRLVEILENAGEDPQAVIRALMQDDEIAQLAAEMGVDLGTRTAALRSGSPTLTTLQRTIAAENQQLGPTVARAAQQNLEGIERLINLMAPLDDPAILSVVAQMRDAYFRDALQMRLDQATARASETAGRIINDDPLAGQSAGAAISSIVRDSLRDARDQERALYAAVDLNQPAGTGNFSGVDNILETIAQIRSRLLPESPFPTLITKFAERVGEEGAEVTLRDVVNFRSEMLSFARDATAAGNFRDANFYGRMAEAALDDLGMRADPLPGGIDPNIPMMRDTNQRALANAFAFSRALNDVFTRSFAGATGARTRTGAPRLPPEILGRRILGSGADATSLRLAQLEEAAQFMAREAGPEFAATAAERLGTMRSAEQTILRIGAEQTINPETGQVNPVALARFMRQNAAALDRFPTLRDDLRDAVTAQQLLRNVNDANSIETRALENSRIFQAVLGAEETPAGAVAVALGEPGGGRDRSAVANLNHLIRLANTAGDLAPQARAGLRDAVLDRAIVYATESGTFDFNRFRRFLMEPISRSQPSVTGVLRDGGILTSVEATQLNRLLTEFDNIQSAIDAGGPRLQETVIDAPAAAFDLVTTMISAGLGSQTASRLGQLPFFGTNTLVVSGAFARQGRNMFQNMPRTYFKDMLNEAITRPEVMADFLERGVDRLSRRGRRIDRRMNAFLINAGLQPARQEVEDITRAGIPLPFSGAAQAATLDPAVLEQYLQSLQQTAPAPAIPAAAPQPAPATLPAGAPPPAAPAAAPTAPRAGGQQGRASYAALFPNDPIAPIVQQREIAQGIGSLMGGPR
jgi:hypothetical protein